MDLKDYQAGVYKKQYQYQSFMPSLIGDHDWFIDDTGVIGLLSETDMRLGELNASSRLLPDVDLFIKMFMNTEALASCRIAGAQISLEDVLRKIEDVAPEKRNSWEEVHNYLNAMSYSFVALEKIPISTRLLNDAHKILMQEATDKTKQPGELRHSQNWMGGASLNDALYIPPHNSDLSDLMTDLEHFLNDEAYPLPKLVRIAIAHYQIETIYPYFDGNGRLGRLLVLMYLVSKGVLVRPTLYLSDFFDKYKKLYFDNLTRVRTHNDLTHWIKFFLEGVRQVSNNSIKNLNALIALKKEFEAAALSLGKRSKLAQNFLTYLFKVPVVDSQDVATTFSITLATSLRLIEDFVRLGIIREVTGGKRNRIFVFSKYIQLFE